MGKWVSIYFKDFEYVKLKRVLEKEARRRRRKISAYKLIKEWVLDRLIREDSEE